MSMLPARLDIFAEGAEPVGALHDEGAGVLRLLYAPTWLRRQGAYPLSLFLPLRAEAYEGDSTASPLAAALAELLPVGDARTALARCCALEGQGDVYALLAAAAGDVAGAFTFLPAGQKPKAARASYVPMDEAEFIAALEAAAHRPMMVGEGVRQLLPCASAKLPLFTRGGRFYLPHDGVTGNVILQAAHQGQEEGVYNRLFALRLARRSGLHTVEAQLCRVGLRPQLLIERYDRMGKAFFPQRLPQEALASVLANPASYERDGGPSLAACADVLWQYSAQPLRDVRQLFRWVVYNAGIGNMAAHARKLALVGVPQGDETSPARWQLAPFFGLRSTLCYGGFSRLLPMNIGRATRCADLCARDWQELAQAFRFSPKAGLKLAEEHVAATLKVLPRVADELIAEGAQAGSINMQHLFMYEQLQRVGESLVR